MSIILEDDDKDDVEVSQTTLISDATIEYIVARQKAIQEIVKARLSDGPFPASPQVSIGNSTSNSSTAMINFLGRPPLQKKSQACIFILHYSKLSSHNGLLRCLGKSTILYSMEKLSFKIGGR